MILNWINKKIKEVQYAFKTFFYKGLIRKSFSDKAMGVFAFEFARENLSYKTLTLCLVFLLPLFIWETGNSKINTEFKPAAIEQEEINLAKSILPPVNRTEVPEIINKNPAKKVFSNLTENPLKKEEKWEVLSDKKTFLNRPVRNTILVDKANLKIYVAQRGNDYYKVLKEFPVSIGKVRGSKVERGDERTPEGIYKVINVMFDRELLPKYGPMAFVLSYPNDRDRLLGKSGSGIWIHGTGQGALTPDTKGCVELSDQNILDISAYLAYNTPIFIFPERRPLTKKGDRISVSLVNGLEKEYIQELPLLRARLSNKEKS